jgi:hypothetical protein
MGKKVFISYSHAQEQWVLDRLVPCLRAGGAEVRIDRERFTAGKAVVGQMDAEQDAADISVLVFSPPYLASPYCLHEMHRAITRDPQFHNGLVIPVKRDACDLPEGMRNAEPLYVNLVNDKDAQQWDLLLQACDADLGVAAPEWLNVRDTICRFLQRRQSVNVVVLGYPKWRELIDHICADRIPDLRMVDLDNGATARRSGLVEEILKTCGLPTPVPEKPKDKDLAVLQQVLSSRTSSRLALTRFDRVKDRVSYDVNFFAALNHLIESRHLVLLVESRNPVKALLPQDRLSSFDSKLHVVELKGRA